MDRIIALSGRARAVLHREGDRPIALSVDDVERGVRVVLDVRELRRLRRALVELPEPEEWAPGLPDEEEPP